MRKRRSNSNVFKKMGNNFKANSKSAPLKKLAYGIVGGVLYPIIPTLIMGMSGQKVTQNADGSTAMSPNIDMNGWTGLLTGGLGTVLIGMVANKMEIAYGGIAAMTTHLMYVKANDKIVQMIDSPIFAFDKSVLTGGNANMHDGELPAGLDYITLPNGQRVVGQSAPLDDYTNSVADYTDTVADYTNTVADYTNTVADGDSDYDFESAVANGAFS